MGENAPAYVEQSALRFGLLFGGCDGKSNDPMVDSSHNSELSGNQESFEAGAGPFGDRALFSLGSRYTFA